MLSGVEVDESKRLAITADMNLAALRRQDPSVTSIVCSSTHVAVYELPIEGEKSGQWQRLDIEGPLFIVVRTDASGSPSHRVIVTNRKSPLNFCNDITPGAMNLETADRMIMFQDATGKVSGLWFFVGEDVQRVFDFMVTIATSSKLPTPSVPRTETNSVEKAENENQASRKDPKKRKQKTGRQGGGGGAERKPDNKRGSTKPTISISDISKLQGDQIAARAKNNTAISANMEQGSAKEGVEVLTNGKGKESSGIERFFPNVKLTNGVAGLSPPVELTRNPETESVVGSRRRENTAELLAQVQNRTADLGLIDGSATTKTQKDTENEPKLVPLPYPKSSSEAENSSSSQNNTPMTQPMQKLKSSTSTESAPSSVVPSRQHDGTSGFIPSHVTVSDHPEKASPAEYAGGVSGPVLSPFVPPPTSLMPMPHLMPPQAFPHGSMQHGIHPGHYYQAMQSKISMLKNQSIMLANRQQQLAMQVSSHQHPHLQQQPQEQLDSTQAQSPKPASPEHLQQPVPTQYLSAQGAVSSGVEAQELQIIRTQQLQIQQTIAQLQQQMAQQQMALAQAHLISPNGIGPLGGPIGHVVPGMGNMYPVVVPSVPHGRVVPAITSELESLRAGQGSAKDESGVVLSSTEGRGGSLATGEQVVYNAGLVTNAVAVTASEVDKNGEMDRAHFRAMLQRLLADKKLFERAFAHYKPPSSQG